MNLFWEKAKHTPFDNKTGWLKFLHECLIPKTTYAFKKKEYNTSIPDDLTLIAVLLFCTKNI